MVPEIRNTFSKYAGNFAESGSVSFLFDQVGRIEYSANIPTADEIMKSSIKGGANEVESLKTEHVIYTEIDFFRLP